MLHIVEPLPSCGCLSCFCECFVLESEFVVALHEADGLRHVCPIEFMIMCVQFEKAVCPFVFAHSQLFVSAHQSRSIEVHVSLYAPCERVSGVRLNRLLGMQENLVAVHLYMPGIDRQVVCMEGDGIDVQQHWREVVFEHLNMFAELPDIRSCGTLVDIQECCGISVLIVHASLLLLCSERVEACVVDILFPCLHVPCLIGGIQLLVGVRRILMGLRLYSYRQQHGENQCRQYDYALVQHYLRGYLLAGLLEDERVCRLVAYLRRTVVLDRSRIDVTGVGVSPLGTV